MQSTRAIHLLSKAAGSNLQRSSVGSMQQVRTYKAPAKEIQFLLDEVYDAGKHYESLKHTNGEAASPDMVTMLNEEMMKFSENTLSPLNEAADREGCVQLGPNEVKTPTGFKEAYDDFVAGGWQGLTYPEQYGGQNLPNSLGVIQSEMVACANWTWGMYPGLSKGAINTILAHCTEELKEKYLHKMVAGEWTGTMCLTEPQCGSDLAQVTTKAIPQPDGTYKITGTKIFISCGEHDFTDNIVHCVLARLPDAPEGTRGISLFAVPKKLINEDGSVGELNGATIGRIEDKMGCHGSSTCEINFDDSVGELIGTANKGLPHMFTFINTSRLGTAIQGLAAAESSYQNALGYARERLAMRSLSGKKNPDGPADPIIVHPGVRQLLLTQKAIAEGGRSMIYECAFEADKMVEAEEAGDDKAAKKVDDRLGFLTPILKGFLTEVGLEAANHGIQVYGGHGYIKSNKQEQIVRDVRIASVWEGTTQIQALDLLGRKIMLQKLKPINEHCSILQQEALDAIKEGGNHGKIRSHALKILSEAMQWRALTYKIGMDAQKNKDSIGHASVPYLMYAGYVSLGAHWLKMERAASKGLDSNPTPEQAEFYKAKLATADFYFENMLPRTKTCKTQMFSPLGSVMDMKAEHFSFDY